MMNDNGKGGNSEGRPKRWLSKHPRVAKAVGIGAKLALVGNILFLGAVGGWAVRDYQASGTTSKPAIVESISGTEETAVGSYVLEHLVEDWEKNRQNLEEANQRKGQINVVSSLTHRVDKTAAEIGQITLAVYNINHPEDSAQSYDAAELESVLNSAFSRLNMTVKVRYENIELGTLSSEQLMRSEFVLRLTKVEDALDVSSGSGIKITSDGKVTQYKIPGLKETLEEVIGKEKLVKARGPQASEDNGSFNIVDSIAVLSNFSDSGAAGVSFHNTGDEGDAYMAIDKISGGKALDIVTLALSLAHESAHKLGIEHADFPLDVMSYAPKAFRLIRQHPELAFGPESVNEWKNIRADYDAIKGLGEFGVELIFPQGTACANTGVPVAATAPLRGMRLKVTLWQGNSGSGYSTDAEKDSKYMTVMPAANDEGEYRLETVVFKGDAAITTESMPLSIIDCTSSLEQRVEDKTGGGIASLQLSNSQLAGVPLAYTLTSKGHAFKGYVTVLREGEAKPVSEYYIFSSGGNPFESSITLQKPGKYAIFVALQSSSEKPEVLQKVFEVK